MRKLVLRWVHREVHKDLDQEALVSWVSSFVIAFAYGRILQAFLDTFESHFAVLFDDVREIGRRGWPLVDLFCNVSVYQLRCNSRER